MSEVSFEVVFGGSGEVKEGEWNRIEAGTLAMPDYLSAQKPQNPLFPSGRVFDVQVWGGGGNYVWSEIGREDGRLRFRQAVTGGETSGS